MNHNLGNTDRLVRAVVGLALIGYGIYAQSWIGAIGIIPLGTAAIGWCPLYMPFKLNTCKRS